MTLGAVLRNKHPFLLAFIYEYTNKALEGLVGKVSKQDLVILNLPVFQFQLKK